MNTPGSTLVFTFIICAVIALSSASFFENNVNEMAKLVAAVTEDNNILPEDWRVVHTYREQHDKNKVFANRKTKEVVIAYGGTEPNLKDWAKNLDVHRSELTIEGVNYGSVHSGFLKQFQKTENDMFRSAMPYVNSGYKLEITGHSQGAAVATIASAFAKEKYKVQNPKVVTFGSPSVGDSKFAKIYNSLVTDHTRVVNTFITPDGKRHTEIVPRLLPPFTGYRHVGTLMKVTSGLGGTASAFKNHEIQSYEKATRNEPVLNTHGPIVKFVGKSAEKVAKGTKKVIDRAGKTVGGTLKTLFVPTNDGSARKPIAPRHVPRRSASHTVRS